MSNRRNLRAYPPIVVIPMPESVRVNIPVQAKTQGSDLCDRHGVDGHSHDNVLGNIRHIPPGGADPTHDSLEHGVHDVPTLVSFLPEASPQPKKSQWLSMGGFFARLNGSRPNTWNAC